MRRPGESAASRFFGEAKEDGRSGLRAFLCLVLWFIRNVLIGSLQLKSNLFLSPLAGYTNLPFRLVVRGIGGLDLATTEVVNVCHPLAPEEIRIVEEAGR
jgi:hypothetical protein